MEKKTNSIIWVVMTVVVVCASTVPGCDTKDARDSQQSSEETPIIVSDSTPNLDTTAQSTTAPDDAVSSESHSGRLLNTKSVAEWRAATDADRMATSEDIVMRIGGGDAQPADIRQRAVDMEACISEAVRDGSVDASPVSQIAAACAVLLGY